MPHTPRLCIDGRAAAEFPARGLLAHELIDQLVSAQGEARGPSDWVEKQRTVLVSHPRQVFAGQLRRFDTRRRIGRSPFYWLWEARFARAAAISAFHRFRPADRMRPNLDLQTINTVLPASGRLPRRIPFGVNHRFVVPSRKDAELLHTRFRVPAAQVAAFKPGVRRYVHFTQGPVAGPEKGLLLFLSGSRATAKLERVLSARFPNLTPKSLSLDGGGDFSPGQWVKWLSRSSLVFYLDESPFDWGTLFLESVYWRVPTLFAEGHSALGELVGGSKLRLSSFLVDSTPLEALRQETEKARAELAALGVFDPLSLAQQYAEIYERLLPVIN